MKINKNLTIEQEDKFIIIENGRKFIKNLKKAAELQKAIHNADMLEYQAMNIENVPNQTSNIEELELCEQFEIYEE